MWEALCMCSETNLVGTGTLQNHSEFLSWMNTGQREKWLLPTVQALSSILAGRNPQTSDVWSARRALCLLVPFSSRKNHQIVILKVLFCIIFYLWCIYVWLNCYFPTSVYLFFYESTLGVFGLSLSFLPSDFFSISLSFHRISMCLFVWAVCVCV